MKEEIIDLLKKKNTKELFATDKFFFQNFGNIEK